MGRRIGDMLAMKGPSQVVFVAMAGAVGNALQRKVDFLERATGGFDPH